MWAVSVSEPLVETRGFKMIDVWEAGCLIGLDVFLVDASIILKPPISMGGLNKSSAHIYHLFKNIPSDVMF